MTHHTHDEVASQKHLPRVGQTVRSKKHGTLWRVMEKREIWQHNPPDLQVEQPHLVPAIYFIFWKIQEEVTPGIGIMRGHAFTLYDTTFESNWEVVESGS